MPCALPTPSYLAGSCTQWDIYDEYIKDLERQRMEEQMKSRGAKKQQLQGKPQQQEKGGDAMHSAQLAQVGCTGCICGGGVAGRCARSC